ncbi:hypothetical protein [Arthrobacter sp. MMS24-S77]
MMEATDTLFQIEALGPTGTYRSRSRTPITGVSGVPVAELGTVSVPYVARAMSLLRKAPDRDLDQAAMLAEAGRLFR